MGRSLSSPQLNSPPPSQVRGGQKRLGHDPSQQTPQKTPRRSPRLNTIQQQLLASRPSPVRRIPSSPSAVAAQPIPEFDDAIASVDATRPGPSLREAVRSSHRATEEWYMLYEQIEYGSIPAPDKCIDAPPSQKPLADVPHTNSLRKRSVLGHFYTSSDDSFVCCVVTDKSAGKMWSIVEKVWRRQIADNPPPKRPPYSLRCSHGVSSVSDMDPGYPE